MSSPIDSFFKRVPLQTIAIGTSIVTTIVILGVIIHMIVTKPFDGGLPDPIDQLGYPPSDRFATIRSLGGGLIEYADSTLTLDEFAERTLTENWSDRTQVHFIIPSPPDSEDLSRIGKILNERRVKRVRIEPVTHPTNKIPVRPGAGNHP